jgi:hypothetical protein
MNKVLYDFSQKESRNLWELKRKLWIGVQWITQAWLSNAERLSKIKG